MRLKQAAVARVGVERAFALLRESVQVPGLDELRKMPIAPLGATARTKALHYSELWAGGEHFVRQPPMVANGKPPDGMPGRRRAGYLACLENARSRGRSSVIFHDGLALVDAEAGEATFADNPEYDPGLLAQSGDDFWTMQAHAPLFSIDEAFWLAGAHTVDFGHWVTEYLPKLMTAQMAGLPPGVPVLVDANIPATIRAALPLLLGEGTPIVSVPHLAPVQVGRLWCAPTPQYAGFYATEWNDGVWAARSAEPARLASLSQRLRAALMAGSEGEAAGPERLFLARKPSRWKKKLLNHEAIEAIARERGFVLVYPEDFSLAEQVRLAWHAKWIVAPEGSNGLLAFFARAGARVCALSPRYTYPLGDVSAILAASGVRMQIFLGEDVPSAEDFCPFWNDYNLDEAAFRSYLDRWLQE